MSTIRILAIGDVCGKAGLNAVKDVLPAYRRFADITFCAVNAENTNGLGVTPAQCSELLSCGADVLTLGNHTFSYQKIVQYLDETEYVLRPENISSRAPGRGCGIYETRYGDICVMNLIGRVGMDPCDSPFDALDRLLKRADVAGCAIKLLDFHAEATSEKIALTYYADGRVSAVWGTHTHVQTNDPRVLPNGTGALTDAGMCGSYDSVIGMKIETSLSRFLGDPQLKHEQSDNGNSRVEGVLFEIVPQSGRCASVELVRLEPDSR